MDWQTPIGVWVGIRNRKPRPNNVVIVPDATGLEDARQRVKEVYWNTECVLVLVPDMKKIDTPTSGEKAA